MKTNKSGKLIITSFASEKLHNKSNSNFVACFIVDNRLEYIKVIPEDEYLIPGTILTAKVQNVVPNIPAAFLSLNEDKTIGFLPLQNESYRSGEEVLVQVVREPMKTKDYTVTTKLSLNSNYTVASVGTGRLLFSQKLSPKKKEFIIDYLVSKAFITREKGLIGLNTLDITIRTEVNSLFNDDHIDLSPLIHDINETANALTSLIAKAQMRTCYSVHHKPIGWLGDIWNDLSACGFEIEEYVTDCFDIRTKLYDLIPAENHTTIRLYDDKQISLSALYGLQSKMEEVLNKRVWLKSGAYLVIEPTEAMTVIDINSGKNIQKTDHEQLYLDVNVEAANEIARQIRLRNISGVIIIDFINMKSKESYESLISELFNATKNDFSKVDVYNFTKLGLLELTRAKKSKALHELL